MTRGRNLAQVVGGLVDAAIVQVRAAASAGRAQAGGQGLAEYALILALIIIVAVVVLIFFGGQVKTILSSVSPTGAPSSAAPSVARLLSPTGN